MSRDEQAKRRSGTLMTARCYVPSPVESTPPAFDLPDPEPVAARRATRSLVAESPLDDDAREGLIGAVSEVVTNASLHGRPPVQVQGWLDHGAATITVHDAGDGPGDPEVGLRPAPRDPGQGGFGLWLARQMCSELAMGRGATGFTVRLVARPAP